MSIALFVLLVVSIGTVAYVIFFRTVFASESVQKQPAGIIFEEPDPPQHRDIDRSSGSQRHKRPKVAIIIDDMGYHGDVGNSLLQLPIKLTFSFLPFAPFARDLEQLAHDLKQTILLHLPLEAKDPHWNPGPGALYLEDSAEDQIVKFQSCLMEVRYAIGVNNHMGSSFTEDDTAMRTLLQQVKSQGLVFIDSYTTSASVGLSLAQELEVKSGRRDVFLDNIQEVETICEQLKQLTEIAEKKGVAIGIGHPYEATLQAIKQCTPQYQKRVEYVGVDSVL